jgi:hypothetical protein
MALNLKQKKMKSSKNLLYPTFYGCAGLLIGFLFTFWWASNGLTLFFMVIFFPIFYVLGNRSILEIEANVYNYVRYFGGEFGNYFLPAGYQHFFLGFINKGVKRFLIGDFGFVAKQRVEHRIPTKTKSLKSLFDYQKDLSYIVTLRIGQHKHKFVVDFKADKENDTIEVKKKKILEKTKIKLVKKFFTRSGGKELLHSRIDLEESRDHWTALLHKDIESTLSLIAMHRGFAFMQANADWTLRELIFYGAIAARELNKEENFKPDSLQKTLRTYSLKLVSIIVDTKLESGIESVERKKISDIIQAETDAKVILQIGRAKTAVKTFETKKVGRAAAEVKRINIEVDIEQYNKAIKMLDDSSLKLSDEAKSQTANLMVNLFANEQLIVIGGPDGKQLDDDLIGILSIFAANIAKLPKDKQGAAIKDVKDQILSKTK